MGARKSTRRPRAGAKGEAGGDARGASGDRGVGKRYTPEQRREAVEAFHKSGLTQAAFAKQWDVSHVTLGAWLRKHASEGPQGLERVSATPPRRRGRAPLAPAVRDEVVAVHRRFRSKIVLAVGDVWRAQAVHTSRPRCVDQDFDPRQPGQRNPPGQRSPMRYVRQASSVENRCSNSTRA